MSAFATSVDGVAGTWPQAPARWSYSSLIEAEQCPRRWALLRASYPQIWNGRGYPRRPSVAALCGVSVHRGVELIIRALVSAGLEGVQDPGAPAMLRSLGGLSSILASVTGSVLDEQRENPRAAHIVTDLRQRLSEEAPTVRAQVQQILSRMELRSNPPGSSEGGGNRAGQLPVGSYPEQLLEAPDLGFAGVVDLLLVGVDGVTITDYKTGIASADHWDQALIYAVLWLNDDRRNPTKRAVLELRIEHPSERRSIIPTGAEIARAARELVARTAAARASIDGPSPEARIGEDHCPICPVRHLCDEYWSQQAPVTTPPVVERRPVDLVVQVLERLSDRSATVAQPASKVRSVLSAEPEFLEPGRSLRMLGVFVDTDPDSGSQIISAGRYSEIFRVAEGQ